MKFYLEQLISALHDTDIERLKKMDLKKSKMKNYLALLIENRKKGIPRQDKILDELGMDDNAFRKMKSVLFTKCIGGLVPEGGIALLLFLSRYRLPEIFIREADEMINAAEKDNATPADKKAALYLQAIHGYMRLPFSLYNPKKVEHYLQGLRLNYEKPERQAIEELVKVLNIYMLVTKSFFALDTSEANYEEYLVGILSVKQKASEINFKRATLCAEGIQLILDFYYRRNYPQLQEGFNRLVQQYAEWNSTDAHDEVFAFRFYEAYCFILMNNFAEANRLLGTLHADFKHVFHHYPNVVYRYALSLMMEGRIDESKKLIDLCLDKKILPYDNDCLIMSCIANTAYYLLVNDLKQASAYIALYHTVYNKKMLLIFEVTMRFLEVIFTFQSGEVKKASGMFKKFTRYLNDKSDLKGIQNLLPEVKQLYVHFEKFASHQIDINQLDSETKKMFNGNLNIGALALMNAIQLKTQKATGV